MAVAKPTRPARPPRPVKGEAKKEPKKQDDVKTGLMLRGLGAIGKALAGAAGAMAPKPGEERKGRERTEGCGGCIEPRGKRAARPPRGPRR